MLSEHQMNTIQIKSFSAVTSVQRSCNLFHVVISKVKISATANIWKVTTDLVYVLVYEIQYYYLYRSLYVILGYHWGNSQPYCSYSFTARQRLGTLAEHDVLDECTHTERIRKYQCCSSRIIYMCII